MVNAVAPASRVSLPDSSYFVDHLAALSNDQKISIREDIFDADGTVLVRRGEAFETEVAARLRGRQLASPIASHVQLQETIDPDVVINVWSRIRETYRDLDQLEQRMGIADDFETVARAAPIPPVIWQVATVMFERRPDWFQLAVHGAWWAVAIAREAGYVDIDVLRAFAAALTRDLGFLFIDARHIDRPGFLEGGTRAWRAVQGHVETGQRLWLESGAPGPWGAAVGRAVFEHHERINGTGYPDRPQPEHLDHIGQVVGMADMLAAVRLRRFKDSGRNVKDALPLVLVSSDCFPKPILDAAVRGLSRSGLRSTTVCDFSNKNDLLDHLLSRAYMLRHLTKALQDLPSFEPVVLRGQPPPPPSALTRAIGATIQMLLRSGVNQTELGSWLEMVRNGRATARMHELCEMDLQQGEALWRIEQIRRLLAEYVEIHQPRSGSGIYRVLTQLQNPMSV